MSRFFTSKLSGLSPYTPGEQPKDQQYIKLNTNESPFPPSPSVAAAVQGEVGKLQLYSDPECTRLTQKLAERYGVDPDMVLVTNGSDEVLNFAFLAFSDAARSLIFPDITYGFYPVFAELNRIPYTEIPLKKDFSIDVQDYLVKGKTAVIANPNAPTGLALSLAEIEKIVAFDPDRVVIVDEAYVDFGAESAVGLVSRYDNLLVTQTFSKSRSMAGARLGFGIGSNGLIADLNTIKFSTNPYNVNRLSAAAGVAALAEDAYYSANCRTIEKNRQMTTSALTDLGFTVLDSKANFVFACSSRIDGEELYRKCKEKGVLIRHFSKERISGFNRITIGTEAEMQAFIQVVKTILEEKEK